ncbi:sodium- and chloride-dependent GABA transporter 1 [Exaiptasia diaphana]|uniref:Transporter n=1 Tax=Exaiptasia diaphana TaxID=2652724 RepID=A0A913XN35_EXADI|nr:sodium- and chloride-dependent GABA transporter 1 [Exaiptasia diaphana]
MVSDEKENAGLNCNIHKGCLVDPKGISEYDSESDDSRESWSSKADFFLATVGYVVGFGNLWRFPYLCYRNGGASFILPYFLMLAFVGVPMFFMEISLGQWYNCGLIGVWKGVCPLASGIGYGTLVMQIWTNIYYTVIMAWVLFFLFDTMRSDVPWSSCDNDWNTPFCRIQRTSHKVNCSAFDLPVNCTQKFVSPSSEYWSNRVLQITGSIEEMGSMRWELVGTLILGWIMVYLCICKSIKATGKVVYFTATFPYVALVIILVRGVTLDGAARGIRYYLEPDWEQLADPQVWVYAATQIFWSLGIGFGAILTFGSYNKFSNNCYKDSIIITSINCITSFVAGFAVFSILGFMADVLSSSMKDVVSTGPGLVFIAYPEAISQLPVSVFWAILFFFMLMTLGLDTMFGAMEGFITAIIDEFPKWRSRKWLLLAGICVAKLLAGLPCVTKGGMYIFNMFDYQSAGISLLFLVFLENIAIAWIYGIDKFSEDIFLMTGKKLSIWIRISLKFISPVISLCILLANIINWRGIKYNGEPYPDWAEFMGWILCISSMAVPVAMAIYLFIKTPGSLKERWVILTTPDKTVQEQITKKHRRMLILSNEITTPL